MGELSNLSLLVFKLKELVINDSWWEGIYDPTESVPKGHTYWMLDKMTIGPTDFADFPYYHHIQRLSLSCGGMQSSIYDSELTNPIILR